MDKNTVVIAIDHGWSNMKTVHETFTSGIREITTEPALFENVLEKDGKYYKVGSERLKVKDSKVEDENYYLLSLAATAKELDRLGKRTANVYWAVGLPLTRFGKEKEAFIKYLDQNREVTFKYEKKQYHINLDAERLGGNELLIHIDGVLSNLRMRSEHEKFEDALNQIGIILGFVCSRPDKETGGYGPDNLWAIDSSQYLVIECKSEATTQTIKKDYCNQLSGSVNWFKENYVYPNEYIPIMVHPSKVVDAVASPDEKMRVITEKELECFRKNVRDFYSSLCQNGNINDVSNINELLRMYKLRKDDIVNMYTVEFERQK